MYQYQEQLTDDPSLRDWDPQDAQRPHPPHTTRAYHSPAAKQTQRAVQRNSAPCHRLPGTLSHAHIRAHHPHLGSAGQRTGTALVRHRCWRAGPNSLGRRSRRSRRSRRGECSEPGGWRHRCGGRNSRWNPRLRWMQSRRGGLRWRSRQRRWCANTRPGREGTGTRFVGGVPGGEVLA
ncbi:hypothetical protein N656DRAFT_374384 [Canariomyces notabilis]|uniref:Uncharacterized protein n=1 Tax=Canariomyces notabilis TaxID=2074819 RepID=A0AAN6QID8_9PEZI|nr:hypothetical protein N656DRAFT_374384 [Canariomyces arenarius]